ncbi:hypothetical protein OE88DRAFT_1664987, partial [Heliocybe sulcata]
MTMSKVINQISIQDRCTTCPDLDGGRGICKVSNFGGCSLPFQFFTDQTKYTKV